MHIIEFVLVLDVALGPEVHDSTETVADLLAHSQRAVVFLDNVSRARRSFWRLK